MLIRNVTLFSIVWLMLLFLPFSTAHAARLLLSPSSGTFEVGSTFNVSIFVDTEAKEINAFDLGLLFPPSQLQVVSPSGGKSITGVWTAPPSFDNRAGLINLQGGIPEGINADRGLIATITFRATRVGTAALRFSDDTRILLHDGKGTDSLSYSQSGIYTFVLPPPSGPIVASETHPDQTQWHSNSTALLRWAADSNTEGFSYILNENPVEIPDNISEGLQDSVVYPNLSPGLFYFHIKALRDGIWGGVTHFALAVDTKVPAQFPVKVLPSTRTTSRNPILTFETTDAHSGIDYYEYAVIPLFSHNSHDGDDNSPLFIETGPQVVLRNLEIGSYDAVVHVYDKAGNMRESSQRFRVVNPIFRIAGSEGLLLGERLVVSWFWSFFVVFILIGVLGYTGWRVRKWHRYTSRRKGKEIPDSVKDKLKELQGYRKKYGKLAAVFLILISSLFVGHQSYAQVVDLMPPLVSTISRDITNEDIFYIGGKTGIADVEVVLFLQNLERGETTSYTVVSDNNGNWFYRHNAFLTAGDYRLWVQSRISDRFSPPSPEITLSVSQTALQFGSSRVSIEALYLILILLLLLVVVGLIVFVVFHGYHGRKKHQVFLKEIREAEESVRRGFAVLRRDLQVEFAVIKKTRESRELSAEEHQYKEKLLNDLSKIEADIGKEIWDVKQVGNE